MFGVPFYKSKVDEERYEKKKIIEEINHNYNVDPNRNAWDSTSNLHHSYNDNDNPLFKKISYDSLVPLYKEHVINYLNLYFDQEVQYNFYITNYTCFAKGQHMRVHNHPRSCFSGVHYLQFNSEEHQPTLYANSSDWAFYTESFYEPVMRNSHSHNLKHSWLRENFSLNIEEDDIVITPSLLRHSVPVSHSDELRMVIIFHLDIVDE
jgi:hypothetical protein